MARQIKFISQIFLIQILVPVKRNVTAFDNEILLVFDGSLNHLANYWPEISCHLVIILWSKLCIPASDKPHLKVSCGIFAILLNVKAIYSYLNILQYLYVFQKKALLRAFQ